MTTSNNLTVSSDQPTNQTKLSVKLAADKFFSTRPTLWGSSVAPLIRAIAFEAATHPEESDESRAALDAALDAELDRIAEDDHIFFTKGSLVRAVRVHPSSRNYIGVCLVLGGLTKRGHSIARDRRDETMYTIGWTIYAHSLQELEEPDG